MSDRPNPQQLQGIPGIHTLFDVFGSPLRDMLPIVPLLWPIDRFTLRDPFKSEISHARSDLLVLSSLGSTRPIYLSALPELTAMMNAKPLLFTKPIDHYRYSPLDIFGSNILTAKSGPEYKRHKAVVKACFGEDVMENAWDTMVTSWETMIREGGLEEGGVLEEVVHRCLKPLKPSPPVDDLSSDLQQLCTARSAFEKHLIELVHSKRAELQDRQTKSDSEERPKKPQDLFSALVASQVDVENAEGQGAGLSEEEIRGNIFIFLVAGHETTSGTLTFALAWLSIHPEIQEELYDEVQRVCGGEDPSYKDVSRLPLCLAVCYEALRFRAVSQYLPRLCSESTLIPYHTWDTDGNLTRHQRAVEKGSLVITDQAGTQMNAFTWGNPRQFDPKRHLDPANKANFIGFSQGLRQCIGKRFAEVEQVAIISKTIQRYRLYPVARFQGESVAEMEERMTAYRESIALSPSKWSLRLEKR
ncbi:hypothetical protein P7C73_g3312, partial [Tremellales sp. Uapishka_1]